MVQRIKNHSKEVYSKEILQKFFTKENIKQFFSEFQVIFYWLALFWASNLASNNINSVFEEVKYSVQNTLNQTLQTEFDISKQQSVEKIFQKVRLEFPNDDIENPVFQKKLYDEIKSYEETTGTKLLQSLILWFLYGFAYLKTIKRVQKEYMKIDVKSFSTFSLTSGGMVLVNGFIPGSVVYLESFLLAGYTVMLHLKNVVNDKHKTSDNDALNDALKLNPIPTSRYDISGKTLVWNAALEKETGYRHTEVNTYFEKHGEIMSLLYKGKNLEKVQKYLELLQDTWVGYKNVTFTLNAKSGEEKTFLWTTQPDPLIPGWSIRFAQHLTDVEEIKRKLAETEALFKIDKKTKAFNEETFLIDFESILFDKRKKTSFVVGMFDVDNFKALNDKYDHITGDQVLIELVDFLKKHLRDTDVIYRLHGDEFVVVFDGDNIEELWKKIHLLKKEFSHYIQHKLSLEFWVSTTWGLTKIFPYSKRLQSTSCEEEMKKMDRYMYAIKYFKLIQDELIKRRVISESFEEKNSVAYARLDEQERFLWIDVIHPEWDFFLSQEDLELIEIRKKQLQNSQIAHREKR